MDVRDIDTQGRDLPKPGDLWLHYKGVTYRVICLSTHTETKKPLVTYYSDPNNVRTRPLAMFMERFKEGGFRFVKMSDGSGTFLDLLNAGERVKLENGVA